MSEAKCQVNIELQTLRVGMVGLQENDLSLSCQRILTAHSPRLEITRFDPGFNQVSWLESQAPFDLILVDCRTKQRRKDLASIIKSICGNALIMGLVDEDISDVEGVDESAIDWLVNEHTVEIAMPWAIQEGLVRRRGVIEREELRRQMKNVSSHHEMADVASTVLHNVGNVLNSVNVAVHMIHELVSQSSMILVHRIAELLKGHDEHWDTFLTQDPKGKRIPPAIMKLGSHLKEEQQTLLKEIEGLVRNIEHVKHIIISHQTMGKSRGMSESFSVVELLEQAVELSFQPEDAKEIRIQRDYQTVPAVLTDRHQLLQILVNLLRNAKQAMQVQGGVDHLLSLQVKSRSDAGLSVVIIIQDTGIGIAHEHLARLFTRGFTTKHDGNGIGLHSSMVTIQRMGGLLEVYSGGVGTGATLTLTLQVQEKAGQP